jgi:hypothetical protein
MDDPRDIAQKGQEDVDPKMLANANLKKYPQWGKNDGYNDAEYVH